MIDTDKYEGHTEGPWWINHEDGDGATSIWNGTLDEGDMNHVADVDVHDNDLRLIADAPLLLAEVKRLRLDLASGRITTIVNPNDDHNQTLYVTIEFPDGEVYRGYVEKEGEEK